MTEARHAAPAPKCASHLLYGLSCDDYDELVARAESACEICRTPGGDTPHGILHIDHDPVRGQGAVRGLLCSRCNTLLGRGLLDVATRERWESQPLFREPTTKPSRGAQLGPVRQVRIPDDVWAAFTISAGPRNRSQVLTQFARWFNGEPGAELPQRS